MDKEHYYGEIRTDFVDDGYIHVDAWVGNEEEGHTVAVINETTGDVFCLPAYYINWQIEEAIKEVVDEIKTKGKDPYEQAGWLLHEVLGLQCRKMREFLKKYSGGYGGLIGRVRDYEVESVYINPDDNKIYCHLDYPAFEADADFAFLPADERQKIIQLCLEDEKSAL